MLRIADQALTFDDVLLLPGYSEVLPSEVNLSTQLTKSIKLNIGEGFFSFANSYFY